LHTARLAENRLPGNDLYRFAIKRLPGRLKSYLDDYDLPDRVSEAYPANVQSLVLRQANSRYESLLHNNRDAWFHHPCQSFATSQLARRMHPCRGVMGKGFNRWIFRTVTFVYGSRLVVYSRSVSQSRRGFRFLNVERHSSSILIEIDGLPQASLCLLSAADDARVAGNVDQNYDIPRMNLARLEQDCLSFLDCLRPPNRIGETDSRNPRSISNAQQIVPLAKVALEAHALGDLEARDDTPPDFVRFCAFSVASVRNNLDGRNRM
jgi:hypothetical protein